VHLNFSYIVTPYDGPFTTDALSEYQAAQTTNQKIAFSVIYHALTDYYYHTPVGGNQVWYTYNPRSFSSPVGFPIRLGTFPGASQ